MVELLDISTRMVGNLERNLSLSRDHIESVGDIDA